MTSTRTNPAGRCPACFKTCDGATGLQGAIRPKPDDLSVCLYCCNLSVFKQDLTLRPATLEEFESLPKQTQDAINQARFAAALLGRP